MTAMRVKIPIMPWSHAVKGMEAAAMANYRPLRPTGRHDENCSYSDNTLARMSSRNPRSGRCVVRHDITGPRPPSLHGCFRLGTS